MGNKRILSAVLGLVFIVLSYAPSCGNVRVKDIAQVQEGQTVKLFGYGLVVGLNGTGDGSRSLFTMQSIANMLEKMGIHIPSQSIRTKNIASVIVTADISPRCRENTRVDCVVSSIGDARSLQGGVLLYTPLIGIEGTIWAVAQGPLSIGGYNYDMGTGERILKNHATAGRIPGGALVKKDIALQADPDEPVVFVLNNPDFTSARNLASCINDEYYGQPAKALDASMVQVQVPDEYRANRVSFISGIEGLTLEIDTSAKVVINERTGTVVVGENVKISPVAVSHGNLTVEIRKDVYVSQPNPYSFETGETVTVEDYHASIDAEEKHVVAFEKRTDVGQVAEALNELGVTPRDIIAIFQALSRAGALHAELIIM
jgi:flagellar P-ring protein precursor FlgI